MLRLGVIGHPIGHSLSPRMQNAALQALGLDGVYTAITVEPERLHQTVRDLFAQGYDGLNVTIPHKQAVLPFVDELADSARVIGAVNTIVQHDGRLTGHNTDAVGFLRGLSEAGFDPSGANALVLGAGGAARAVVYALRQAGARVTLWNRTRERAERLATEFAVHWTAELPSIGLGRFDLVVNTTSVGMLPNVDASPLRFARDERAPRWVYDLVYRPRQTRFLCEAAERGARTIGGIEMLIHQGAEAFRLFTGCNAPVDVMRKAVSEDG